MVTRPHPSQPGPLTLTLTLCAAHRPPTPPWTNSGKLINPHNPEYITKRPWYLGESGPSLNHHAKQRSDATLGLQEAEEILARKPKFVGRATTYRKGACENCGAMTHKKKDCLERPRSLAKSAKVSGMDIAPDEGLTKLDVRTLACLALGWQGSKARRLDVDGSIHSTVWVSGRLVSHAHPHHFHRFQEFGKLSWDAKRDQWAGYRAEDHERVIER